MHYIGKSKISPLYSKRRVIYPQIRLPQRYNDVIGETAHIFETEYEGKRAFFILTIELDERESKFFKLGKKVLKPEHKVLKPNPENEVEYRLSALESKIDELIELNSQNNELLEAKKPKKDGLEEIRTPDLRRVKASPLLALVRDLKAKLQKMMPV